MIRKLFIALSMLLLCFALSPSQLRAQEPADSKKPPTVMAREARAKNGKRLLSALDLMKIGDCRRTANFTGRIARGLHRRRSQNGEGQGVENRHAGLGRADCGRQGHAVHAWRQEFNRAGMVAGWQHAGLSVGPRKGWRAAGVDDDGRRRRGMGSHVSQRRRQRLSLVAGWQTIAAELLPINQTKTRKIARRSKTTRS